MTNELDNLHPNVQQLSEFLDGKLDAKQSVWIEIHLENCQACVDKLESIAEGSHNNYSVPSQETQNTNHYIDNYYLLEELGHGGMGVVYRAYDPDLKRDIAIKVVSQYASEECHHRLRHEAETIANLTHPGIVNIYSIGTHPDGLYLVMELLYPKGLLTLVKQHNLSNHLLAGLVKQLAETIHYAHIQGVVHRDLKPENILLSPNNNENDPWEFHRVFSTVEDLPQLKITDFGLAKHLDEDISLTRTGTMMGTPKYMAPEQIPGSQYQVGFQSDIYSLGAILYQLLTDSLPNEAKDSETLLKKVSSEEPIPLRQINSNISKDLEIICLKCLRKNPAHRYESAQALADDLNRYLHNEPIQAKSPNLWQRLVLWARQKPIFATHLVGVSLLYALHLFNMLVLELPNHNQVFHQLVTIITIFDLISIRFIQHLYEQPRYHHLAEYLFVSLHSIVVLFGLMADSGPSSAPIYLYSILILIAPLIRPHPNMLWFQVILAILSYSTLTLLTWWFKPEFLVKMDQAIFFYIHLFLTGLIIHLILRRIDLPQKNFLFK